MKLLFSTERKKNVIIRLVEADLTTLLEEMKYMDDYKGPQKWLNKHIRILKRTHFKIAVSLVLKSITLNILFISSTIASHVGPNRGISGRLKVPH